MTSRPRTVEDCNKLGQDRLPGLIGMEVTAADRDGISCRLRIRPDHLAPNGFLHAATVIALADTACGHGAFLALPPEATGFTTIELKSNFLSTLREGEIRCEATPAHIGRSTQVWDAVVMNAATEATLAIFRCTQMVLWPR